MKEILMKNPYIKVVLKYIFYFLRFFAYAFSGLIPRSHDKWIFGSYANAFNDNAKYLFIHVVENEYKIKAIWITSNKEVIDFIRQRGGNAYHRLSFFGVWHCLTSKYWFYNSYLTDINYSLSKGVIAINLWHGVPLKKIEHDIENGPLKAIFSNASFFIKNISHRQLHRAPDYVLSPSEYVSEYSFKSAFKVDENQCLNFGYPRNEAILQFEDNCFVNNKWAPQIYSFLIKEFEKYASVGIYMPTWRDSNPYFLREIDFSEIDNRLKRENSLILLKLHVATPPDVLDDLKKFENIKVLDSKIDIYGILPFTSYLVTDYSSIMFDYLLLNKKIFFYCFDLDCYKNDSRGFYMNYDDIDFGVRINKFIDIFDNLNEFDSGEVDKRINAFNKFHIKNKFPSKSIVEFIKKLY